MDIFEFALQMEKDGRDFYLELSDKAQDKGMQNILKKLAEDEQKHYNAVESLRGDFAGMADTQILTEARNIFEQMKGRSSSIGFPATQADLYRKARDIEKRSVVFYTEKADLVDSEVHRDLFLKLAGEEKKHVSLLEGVIDLVSRPETWLENAEFNHLEDY
jgi:rubrerythrin